MTLFIELEKAGDAPLQLQLFQAVQREILEGRLAPGTRLPSTRGLARQLQVARNTVLLAYDRLIAEGYLEARQAEGTFVSDAIPEDALHWSSGGTVAEEAPSPPVQPRPLPRRFAAPLLYERQKERIDLDFRVGRPDPASFPLKRWRQLINENLAGAGRALTEYGNPAGLFDLRQAVADHLKSARGITADPAQIIIVGGCEEGLNIVARMLAPAGTDVAVENPCYQGVAFVFRSHGARIRPIPVDEAGIRVDRLAGLSQSLVCVTPSHQFPLGHTMSLNRRLRLLEWARSTGSYIVEDDYDSDFRYAGSPLMALAGLDRADSVIYIGTFSKSMGAALRIGYLIVPPHLIGPAREAKALYNLGNPWLEQAALADFIRSGSFATHLRRVRNTYLRRRDTLMAALRDHFGPVQLYGTEGGMHLTWVLPDGQPLARQMQNAALVRGVGIYTIADGPAVDCGHHDLADRALFFGYPCLDEAEIQQAVRHLPSVAQLAGPGG